MKQEQSYCCSPARHEDLIEDMALDKEKIRMKKCKYLCINSIYNPSIFPQSAHTLSLLNKVYNNMEMRIYLKKRL